MLGFSSIMTRLSVNKSPAARVRERSVELVFSMAATVEHSCLHRD